MEPLGRTSRTQVRVDVHDVAPPGCKELALEVVRDEAAAAQPKAVLFCLPGGGMTRRYFDLAVPGYSFAEFAARRGFLVVLVDHPGVGDSDVPADGWALTPTVVASIEAAAVDRALSLLRAGAVEGIPALAARVPVIGVGHSAGAHLLIHQFGEAGDRSRFAGLVLLGWAGRGLPEYLDEADRAIGELDVTDPAAFAAELVKSARRRYDHPLALLGGGSSQLLIKNPMTEKVRAALAGATAPLLVLVGHASIIPGTAKRSAAAVNVPVFLGVGEHDIATDHHRIPGEFPASRDITLYVLPGAGHNHNVEPSREELWERVTSWVNQLASRRN